MNKKKIKQVLSINSLTDKEKETITIIYNNIDSECPYYIPITKSRELDLKENKKMYY